MAHDFEKFHTREASRCSRDVSEVDTLGSSTISQPVIPESQHPGVPQLLE